MIKRPQKLKNQLHNRPQLILNLLTLKKLLAAGERKIFEFARVFRNAEGSALHHPEFTMLEWYRAGAGYETIMEDCAALLGLTGVKELRWQDKFCDPHAVPERLTVVEAFGRYAGVDLFAMIGHAEKLAQASGIAMHPGDTWDDMWTSLTTYVPKVQKRVCPTAPFGVSLRLSNASATTLVKDKGERDKLKKFLADNNMYLYTVNAFPYGPFKNTIVKEQVYEPDWRSRLLAAITDPNVAYILMFVF